MSIINSVLTKIFGSKSEKDMKEIAPILEKIKSVYPSIEKLSNDELRAYTERLKQKIRDAISGDEAEIAELKKAAEAADATMALKEKNFKEVDRLEKEISVKVGGLPDRDSARGVRDYERHGAPLQGKRAHRGDGDRL